MNHREEEKVMTSILNLVPHDTVLTLGSAATEADGELVTKLFGAIGKVWKADEKLFDAITGLRYIASLKILV